MLTLGNAIVLFVDNSEVMGSEGCWGVRNERVMESAANTGN